MSKKIEKGSREHIELTQLKTHLCCLEIDKAENEKKGKDCTKIVREIEQTKKEIKKLCNQYGISYDSKMQKQKKKTIRKKSTKSNKGWNEYFKKK